MKNYILSLLIMFSCNISILLSQNFYASPSTLDFGDGFPGSEKTMTFSVVNNSSGVFQLSLGNPFGYITNFSPSSGTIYSNSRTNFNISVKYPTQINSYDGYVYINYYFSGTNSWLPATSVYTKLKCILPIPSTPINIIQSTTTENSITVKWDKSAYTTGSSDYAEGYNIYLNGVKQAQTTETMFVFSNLNPGTSYNISISAFNSMGESSKVNKTLTTIPLAPSNILVTCCNSTWYRIRCNASYGATSYNVNWGSSVSSFDYSSYCNVYGTIATNTKFKVFAQNSAGTSAYNIWDLATNPAMPEVPYNIVTSNITSNGATLSWSGYSYEDGYNIYVNGVKVSTQSTKSITLNTLSSGTNYQVDIVSFKTSVGESSKLTTNLLTRPNIPTNIQAIKHSNNWYTITCSPVYGASSYSVLWGSNVSTINNSNCSIDIYGSSSNPTSISIWASNISGSGPTAVFSLIPQAVKSGSGLSASLDSSRDKIVPITFIQRDNTIEIDGISNCLITIFDINGKEVIRKNINNDNYLDISTLKNGVYITKIQTENKCIIDKFIKK